MKSAASVKRTRVPPVADKAASDRGGARGRVADRFLVPADSVGPGRDLGMRAQDDGSPHYLAEHHQVRPGPRLARLVEVGGVVVGHGELQIAGDRDFGRPVSAGAGVVEYVIDHAEKDVRRQAV